MLFSLEESKFLAEALSCFVYFMMPCIGIEWETWKLVSDFYVHNDSTSCLKFRFKGSEFCAMWRLIVQMSIFLGFIKLWYLININVSERKKNTQSFPKSCSYSNIYWLIEAYCFLVPGNVLHCINYLETSPNTEIFRTLVQKKKKIAAVGRCKVQFYEQT